MGETSPPELKKFSLNNLGQILKVATDVPYEAFPQFVNLSRKSPFFRDAYSRVFMGDNDPSIEHMGLMAASDMGEIMISETIYAGDRNYALTDITQPKYEKLKKSLHSATFPPGWRTFGAIHSHPIDDILNAGRDFTKKLISGVDQIPATWSLGDFLYLLYEIRNDKHTTFGLISPTHLSLMVGTLRLAQLLKEQSLFLETLKKKTEYNPQRHLISESVKYTLGITHRGHLPKIAARLLRPPFQAFQELGIVTCAASHISISNGDLTLNKY